MCISIVVVYTVLGRQLFSVIMFAAMLPHVSIMIQLASYSSFFSIAEFSFQISTFHIRPYQQQLLLVHDHFLLPEGISYCLYRQFPQVPIIAQPINVLQSHAWKCQTKWLLNCDRKLYIPKPCILCFLTCSKNLRIKGSRLIKDLKN